MARGKKSEKAEKAENGEKASKSWFSRLKLMVAGSILSGGLGLGGYQFRDYPILAAIVKFLTGEAKPGDGTLVKAIVQEVGTAAKKAREFETEGTFLVNLKEVSLDPNVVANDKTPELRAVVVRFGSDAQRQVVWQSKNATVRPGGDASGSLVASFDEPAFEIPWQPGDRLVVEIWTRKLLRGVKLVERADASQEKFPLAPGEYPLKRVANAGKGTDAGSSSLTVEARRKPDPGPTTGTDDAPAVARDGDSDRSPKRR